MILVLLFMKYDRFCVYFYTLFGLTRMKSTIFQNIQRPKPREVWIGLSISCCECSSGNENESRGGSTFSLLLRKWHLDLENK